MSAEKPAFYEILCQLRMLADDRCWIMNNLGGPRWARRFGANKEPEARRRAVMEAYACAEISRYLDFGDLCRLIDAGVANPYGGEATKEYDEKGWSAMHVNADHAGCGWIVDVADFVWHSEEPMVWATFAELHAEVDADVRRIAALSERHRESCETTETTKVR